MMKLNIAIVEDKILCRQWYGICYLFKSPDGKLNGMQQLMSQPALQIGLPYVAHPANGVVFYDCSDDHGHQIRIMVNLFC